MGWNIPSQNQSRQSGKVFCTECNHVILAAEFGGSDVLYFVKHITKGETDWDPLYMGEDVSLFCDVSPHRCPSLRIIRALDQYLRGGRQIKMAGEYFNGVKIRDTCDQMPETVFRVIYMVKSFVDWTHWTSFRLCWSNCEKVASPQFKHDRILLPCVINS